MAVGHRKFQLCASKIRYENTTVFNESVSQPFLPPLRGLHIHSHSPQGLRPGLHYCAASRLSWTRVVPLFLGNRVATRTLNAPSPALSRPWASSSGIATAA